MVDDGNYQMEPAQRQETGSARVFEIDREELKDILLAFREGQNESRETVETRLAKMLKHVVPGRVSPSSTLSKVFSESQLGSIEGGGQGTILLTSDDLTLLANAYEFSPLMVQPLLTRQQDGDVCVQQSLDDFIPACDCPGAQVIGEGATYRIPAKKLPGTKHIAVVYLEIEAHGHSDVHKHVGDELIFVLKGTIEVRLANSGLWTRLNEGDYIHFYAEQEHSAWNLTETSARLFIVRFYQLEKTGIRFDFLKELEDILKQLRKKGAPRPKKYSLERVLQEMIAVVRPFDLTTHQKAPSRVIDTFGMGRLLKLLCSKAFRGTGRELTLKKLAEIGREKGFGHTTMHRLHTGMIPAEEDALPMLARLHNVEPMLLYGFLFPAYRMAVAVRQQSDMRLIPEAFVCDRNCHYLVPSRRLADSNVAIGIFELAAGAKTANNRHPGHELLLPLDGDLKVETRGTEIPIIRAGETLFAHYYSNHAHQVSNLGEGRSRTLLIRFYE